MLLFAFLILPVLGLEYVPRRSGASHAATDARVGHRHSDYLGGVRRGVRGEGVRRPSWVAYLKERWLDLAIVVLPTLEFVLTKLVDVAPLAAPATRPGGRPAATRALTAHIVCAA